MRHYNLQGADLHAPSTETIENNTGVAIPAFKVVTITQIGTIYPEVELSVNVVDGIRGVTLGAIADGAVGRIGIVGLFNNLDTSAWVVGTEIYADLNSDLSSTPNGNPLGRVVRQDAVIGQIYLYNNVFSASVAGTLYTNLNTTPVTIGGIPAGSTFNSQTMTQMFDALLYPYQAPAFTAFTMSGQATSVEVGDTVSGVKTFNWTTSNSANVQVNSISIQDLTNATNLASGLADDSTENINIGSVQKITATSNVWRVTGTNTELDNFTGDFTVNWRWRIFFGEDVDAGPLLEADVEALRVSQLQANSPATYAFVGGGYKYIAYPSSMTTLTTFKDAATLLNVPFQPVYVVSITNTNGITTNYNVHRITNILGGSINIIAS